MAKFKLSKTGFEAELNLDKVSKMAFNHLPEKIGNWFNTRKDKKIIEKAINNIYNAAFIPWKKYWRKFKIYDNFPLPQNEEQFKSQIAHDLKHIYDQDHIMELEHRLDKEFAHFDFIKQFQDENGGKENFGVYLERAIKLNGFTMFPIRKVYTFSDSKKAKAVVILEEFRPYDNSYNIFVYCTKNWGNNTSQK